MVEILHIDLNDKLLVYLQSSFIQMFHRQYHYQRHRQYRYQQQHWRHHQQRHYH